MAKYRFRLETMQKLRAARRDQQRVALAEAFRAEAVLADARTDLVAEQTTLRELQRTVTSEQQLDVNRLIEAQRYELVLRVQEQDLARQEAILAEEVERRREALVEADRAVRVLELLDERQRRDHRRHTNQMEVKELDEMALASSARRRSL
jgi:flagellar protein FliJ